MSAKRRIPFASISPVSLAAVSATDRWLSLVMTSASVRVVLSVTFDLLDPAGPGAAPQDRLVLTVRPGRLPGRPWRPGRSWARRPAWSQVQDQVAGGLGA